MRNIAGCLILKFVFAFLFAAAPSPRVNADDTRSPLSVGQLSEIASARRKYTVCSITINSSEEIEAFREHLPKEHFDFVELLPLEKKEDDDDEDERFYNADSPGWLERACESGLQCDVLVLSGHFTGHFIGKSRYPLSLKGMERMACSRKCAGIFERAREVFLFGCNTLAGKQPDLRQPMEYLQDLLDHNYPRSHAERAMASRYSFLSGSYEQRMRLVFTSDKQSFLYGFFSQSPFGRNVKHMLEDYFQRIIFEMGGYHEHLSQLEESRFPNLFWSRALSVTNQTQTLSAKSGDYQSFCSLYDESRNDKENMILVASLLREEEMTLYFDHISDWLRKRKKFFNGETLHLYQELQNDSETSGRWLTKYEEEKDFLNELPLYRWDWLRFLSDLNWISPEFLKTETVDIIRRLVLRPGPDRYRTLRQIKFLIGADLFQEAELVLEDFPEDYFDLPENLKILGWLNPSDERIHWKITEALKVGDKGDPLWREALSALIKINPSDPAIHWEIADGLNEREKTAVLNRTLGAFMKIKPSDERIHRKIAGLLGHDDHNVVETALWALSEIRPSDPEIHRQIADVLKHKNDEVVKTALWALNQIRPSDPEIHRQIANVLKHKNDEVVEEALWTLATIRPSDPETLLKITAALEHEKSSVRRIASEVLEEIKSAQIPPRPPL